MSELWIEQRRGFAVEGEHPVDAILCRADGSVVAKVGGDQVTTFRSAAKPFQLEATLGLLSSETRAQLSSRDLALGAASHHGEPEHVAQLLSLLARLGRGPEHLYCGVHPPSHAPSAIALYTRGEMPSVLHNNCSGKHAFMAAASAAQGLLPDYRSPSHAVQQHVLTLLHGHTHNQIRGVVVDGCGLPCFVLPLSAMATAWASLACAVRDAPQGLLGSIGSAMHAHPSLVSGSEAFDGWLMAHTPLIAKVGAQGIFCAAVPEAGVGLAVKVRSGSDAVRPRAAIAIIERFLPGVLTTRVPARFSEVFNLVGAHVGEHDAVWKKG